MRASPDYAECGWSDDGPDYAFIRCLGHRVAEVMEQHEQTWAISQVIDSEAPRSGGNAGPRDGGPHRHVTAPEARRGRGAWRVMDIAATGMVRAPGLRNPVRSTPMTPPPTGNGARRSSSRYPAGVDDLVVEIGDPRALTPAERAAMQVALRRGEHGRLREPRRAMRTRKFRGGSARSSD